MSPPVLGFNNNVRHRGCVFHIQTEDSGVKSPHIITHLFADGGHIIKSTRTDYALQVGRPGLAELVRQMMKIQHKAMATALWAGEYDVLLERALGPLPQPPAPRRAQPGETGEQPPPSLPMDSARDPGAVTGAAASAAGATANATNGHAAAKSDPTRPRKTTSNVHARSEASPAFGEQSLDEVILSFIADDVDASIK